MFLFKLLVSRDDKFFSIRDIYIDFFLFDWYQLEAYDKSRPFILFGLLQYEHKMSLINLQVQRDNAYEETVKSKVNF